jgi:ABC-type nickel/cobalt efflux system permease component RcnA
MRRILERTRTFRTMAALLAIVTLGFFLGMRHATDPDHVVAVTTIVSRQRTVFQAAILGALWGVGHTITVLVVGSAIILFKLTIPARLGLSMELSVACMLVVLGSLNLSGLTTRVLQWIPLRRFDPGARSNLDSGSRIVHAHKHSGNLKAAKLQPYSVACHNRGKSCRYFIV